MRFDRTSVKQRWVTAVGTSVLVMAAACSRPGDPTALVASVSIQPPSLAITVGTTVQLTAQVKDASGRDVAGRSVVWSSSNPSVASVSPTGVVTATGVGTARVTAQSEGKSGVADITVAPTGALGTINVLPATTFQTIVGWETTAGIGQLDFQPPDFLRWSNAVLDSAVSIGINRIRLQFRSGWENTQDYFALWRAGTITRSDWRAVRYTAVNDNSSPTTLNAGGFKFFELDETIETVVNPLRNRLAAQGEALYVNLNFTDFNHTGFEHLDNPQEYAEFALVTFQHIKSKYGWVPDAIEMILEPDNSNWNGTQIGQALAATGARLAANGFRPDFIAPSNTNMGTSIRDFDLMMQVSGVSQYLREYSYHRYGGVSDANLQAIGSRAAQYNIGAGMLEHIGSDHIDLYQDLTVGRNTAWQQFSLAFPTTDDGGGNYFLVDLATAKVTTGRRTGYLRQYFKYVRRGAKRIGCASSNAQLHPLAFINANGRYVVVVRADAAQTFTIGGLPPGTYGVSHTTAAKYGVEAGDIVLAAGQLLNTSIPAAGVITVYRKG